VEISTLAYVVNSFLTRVVVSGVLYPYNSYKTNAQKSMFTATGGPTDMPLLVLG
jgi:hypothetical protein